MLCFYFLYRRIACIVKVGIGRQAPKPLNSTEQLGESNEPKGLYKASLSDFKEKETRQFIMKQKLPECCTSFTDAETRGMAGTLFPLTLSDKENKGGSVLFMNKDLVNLTMHQYQLQTNVL